MTTMHWIAAPVVGFIGMMAGGYWGVGSGWIVVPVMLILGFQPLEAVGIGLLQMIPSALPTVLKQTPSIGWGAKSAGRSLVLPLGIGAALTALCGKSLNALLLAHCGPRVLDWMLLLFILAIAFQTLTSRTRSYGDEMPPLSARVQFGAFFVGLGTGLLSSLLGVGGGIIIRPTLTAVYKVPEMLTGKIVRLLVLVTTVTGGAVYLFGVGWSILGMAMLTAAGGMLGFPLGSAMHKIVYDAGYAQHIHKSFAAVALALVVNTLFRIFDCAELSRWVICGIGLSLGAYLVGFTFYARQRRASDSYKPL